MKLQCMKTVLTRAKLMEHYHSASVTVYAVWAAARTQNTLCLYVLTEYLKY